MFRKALMFICLSFVFVPGLATAEVSPPNHDYFLHFDQSVAGPGGEPLIGANHQFAWVEETDALLVTNALTVEAWVFWESSDFEEISTAFGTDMDRMNLLCGQGSYGFQYRYQWSGNGGWSFFLVTTDQQEIGGIGDIPLPVGEWAHLAATYDGNHARAYVNGVMQVEIAVTGNVLAVNDSFDSLRLCTGKYDESFPFPVPKTFIIGPGNGFKGGLQHVRLWNRALSEQEILDNAPLLLNGDEAGLLAYWPLTGPPGGDAIVNRVASGPELNLGDKLNEGLAVTQPTWRSSDPVFEVREDLVEDVIVSDCPTIPKDWNWVFLDLQDDTDLDLVFGGLASDDCWGDHKLPLQAMIRDGENGYVFDNAAAFSATPPVTHTSYKSVVGDFNGDKRADVFSANVGNDYCDNDFGAVDTLLLSRPDGKLEDASDHIVGEPCTATSPQFPGQNMCHMGGSNWGRPPNVLYPEPGTPVTPPKAFTHAVASGDTDGDGDVDIVVGNFSAADMETPYVLVGDGTGNFVADWELLPHVLYETGETGSAAALGYQLADMDGDGDLDFITAPMVLGYMSVEWVGGIFWNDGSGDFSSSDSYVIVPTAGIPTIEGSNAPRSSGAMAVMDIENDGDNDLLINWNPRDFTDPSARSSLQVLVNHGGRQFLDETVKRLGRPPQSGAPRALLDQRMHALDFNGDGCTDLVFDEDGPRALDALVWLNNCQGYFTPSPETLLTKRDGRFLPVDYDGDGDIDFLKANYYPVNYATSEGCAPGMGFGVDYVDFSVLLNVKGALLKSELILKSGFEN